MDTESTRSFLGFPIYRFREPMARRLSQLIPGLVLFGVAMAFTIEAELGTNPWTVFHQGMANKVPISIGTVVVVTGLALMIIYRFIQEPLGLGTLLNALIIGPSIDVTLWLVPDLESLWIRIAMLAIAPVLLGLASGLYIGAGLGPGPRDGLMTAISRRGLSISRSRLIVELTALGVGWLLGGDVGIGTAYFAITVGWFVGFFLPPLQVDQEI